MITRHQSSGRFKKHHAAVPRASLENSPADEKHVNISSQEVTKRKRRPMSEETRRKISQAHQGKRHTEETRRKIAESRKGQQHTEEVKLKISESMKNLPPPSVMTRLRLSHAHSQRFHTDETRHKIGIIVRTKKQLMKRQRLAARAAEAAEAATADLRPIFQQQQTLPPGSSLPEDYNPHAEIKNEEREEEDDTEEGDVDSDGILDSPLELEKAVIELTQLRRQLSSWIDAYENKYGKKPDLTETSETHPLVYGRFVRYVALRELVRRSSLSPGQTPVSWT